MRKTIAADNDRLRKELRVAQLHLTQQHTLALRLQEEAGERDEQIKELVSKHKQSVDDMREMTEAYEARDRDVLAFTSLT